MAQNHCRAIAHFLGWSLLPFEKWIAMVLSSFLSWVKHFPSLGHASLVSSTLSFVFLLFSLLSSSSLMHHNSTHTHPYISISNTLVP